VIFPAERDTRYLAVFGTIFKTLLYPVGCLSSRQD